MADPIKTNQTKKVQDTTSVTTLPSPLQMLPGVLPAAGIVNLIPKELQDKAIDHIMTLATEVDKKNNSSGQVTGESTSPQQEFNAMEFFTKKGYREVTEYLKNNPLLDVHEDHVCYGDVACLPISGNIREMTQDDLMRTLIRAVPNRVASTSANQRPLSPDMASLAQLYPLDQPPLGISSTVPTPPQTQMTNTKLNDNAIEFFAQKGYKDVANYLTEHPELIVKEGKISFGDISSKRVRQDLKEMPEDAVKKLLESVVEDATVRKSAPVAQVVQPIQQNQTTQIDSVTPPIQQNQTNPPIQDSTTYTQGELATRLALANGTPHLNLNESQCRELLKQAKANGLPVVIDFSRASGCGGCTVYKPNFDYVASQEQFKGKVVFIRIDTDVNPWASRIGSFRLVPTTVMASPADISQNDSNVRSAPSSFVGGVPSETLASRIQTRFGI